MSDRGSIPASATAARAVAVPEDLCRLEVLPLRFVLRAEQPIQLPRFSGSTFRGAFGVAFRRVVCALKRPECEGCLLRPRCAYAYIFETPATEGKNDRGEQAPRPFVLRPPPAGERAIAPGEEIAFEVRLFGRAAEFLPYFVCAFDECGRRGLGRGRGRFRLDQVAEDGGRELFTSRSQVLREAESRVNPLDGLREDDLERSSVTVRFTTPTRLQSGGKLATRYNAALLARAAMRRCGDLLKHHCGAALEWDFGATLAAARAVRVTSHQLAPFRWQRYSSRQDEKLDMTGMTGELTLAGELGPLMPWLRAAELTHLGKGTAFGMGRVEIGEGGAQERNG